MVPKKVCLNWSLFLFILISATVLESKNVSEILNNLTQDYDKRLRPKYGGDAVQVNVSIHVSTISAVSEVEMDYTLDMYLRQYWIDPRLQFSGTNQSLTIGIEMVNQIWVPDTFFPNEKQSFFHEATTHNSFLRIQPSGRVSRSMRLTVTANCPMNLEHFPLDSQNCSFEIESYGYSTADIIYHWANEGNASVTMEHAQLAQFKVGNFDIVERSINLSTGNYSRLSAYFTFDRSIGFYLIQIYLPSSLIVVISWVSFWLNREATQARVAIGVTTVLTMTTLMTSTNSQMPKVSYIKSIDIYLGTCFIIVFASLLEYAAVGYLMKRVRMQKEKRQSKVFGSIPLVYQQNSSGNLFGGDNFWGADETTPASTTYYQQPLLEMQKRRSISSPREGSVPLLDATGAYYSSGQSSALRSPLSYLNDPASTQIGGETRGQYPQANRTMDCDCDIESGADRSNAGAAYRTRRAARIIRLKTQYQRQTFKPSNIDKYSRIFFPLIFISFHIIYWTVYINATALGI